jgi:hypothetical protein
MLQLNLPVYNIRTRELDGRQEIYDVVRKRFVSSTSEEWVRQNFLHFLIHDRKFPMVLVAVEKSLTLNRMTKRTDILVHGSKGQPLMIVECKAPEIKINQKVFEQIGRYNLALKVNYLVVTNGMEHYCAQIDFTSGSYRFLRDIPEYENLK